MDQFFPEKYPKRVEMALQKKAVDANIQNVMCQHIVLKLYQKGHDSNKCLKKAAKRITQRWSPFKNPVDEDAGIVCILVIIQCQKF